MGLRGKFWTERTAGHGRERRMGSDEMVGQESKISQTSKSQKNTESLNNLEKNGEEDQAFMLQVIC